MACLIVPAAEALITTVAVRVLEKKAKKNAVLDEGSLAEIREPFCKKLKLLSNLLWGGSALLAFEHLWHGEIEPWFPFLTAAQSPEEAQAMLHEMATVGVTMSAFVTTVWAAIIAFKSIRKRQVALRTVPAEHGK